MAAKKNFIIEQKATFKKRILYRDKFKKLISLVGFRAHMQIKNGATVICDLSTENDKIVLGEGTIDIIIPASETALMTFSSALYDLLLIAPDGTITRLIEGKFTISLGQTDE